MEGFSLRDSLAFDDWQFQQTEHLRREHSQVLSRLVEGSSRVGAAERALRYARQWLALDSLNESAHRSLIEQYARSGQRGAALRQYRACVRILEEELGVAPMHETTAVYEAVRANQLQPAPPGEPAEAALHPTETADRVAEIAPPPARPLAAAGHTQLPLVGRSQELAALRQAYERSARSGQMVCLRGEAGIGKTRLAEEFLAGVRAEGGRVLQARCYEGENNLAYGAIVEALRSGLSQVQDRDWQAELAGFELGEAARLLPELAAQIPADEFRQALDGPGAQARFYEGVTRALLALAGASTGRPGVVFVDDVQWADEGSGRILSYLAHRLSRHPLMLLISWREDGLLDEARLRELTTVPSRQALLTEITLGRLQEAHVQELIRKLTQAGLELPEALHSRMVREAEGVPFFLMAYLHAWQRRGVATQSKAEMPASIQALLEARLAMVSEAGLQLLQTAAVLGRAFSYDLLVEVSGRSEEEAVVALEELERRGLIRTQRVEPAAAPGELAYDFNHEQMRLVVYQQLSMVRKRLLHRRTAESLARRLPAGDQLAYAGQVAHHYREAGETPLAAHFYRLAGQHAASLYANEAALSHYEAALALGEPDRAALYLEIGNLEVLLGNYGSAIQNFEAAAALSTPGQIPVVEHRLGQVHERLGEWVQAGEYYQSAQQALEEQSNPGLAVRILADWSLLLHRQGSREKASELAHTALEAARETDDQEALAQVYNLLGILARHQENPRIACEQLRTSLDLAEQLGNLPARTAALNNLALALGDLGAYDEALELVHTALQLSIQQGDRHREAAARNNLADLLRAMGDEQAAMQELKQAVAVFADVGLDTGSLQPEIWKLVEW
jgi:predicted ATPase